MKPEQQAEEILIQEGFAEPEDLEPEVAKLLKRIAESRKRPPEGFFRALFPEK